MREALKWLPLAVTVTGHASLVVGCLSRTGAPDGPALCSAPPITTLILLGLAYAGFTRGSPLRGTIALAAIGAPLVLRIVSEVIG